MPKIGDPVVTAADVEALPIGTKFGELGSDINYTRVEGGFTTYFLNAFYECDIQDHVDRTLYVNELPEYQGRHCA